MLKHLFFSSFLFFSSSLTAQVFDHMLDLLKESPYGFSMIDLAITAEDVEDFHSIDIQKEYYYQQFGEIEQTENKIADFLSGIGTNERDLVERISNRLAEMANELVEVSGRETAWIHLHAFIPTSFFDLSNWHIDGYYYSITDPSELVYKFVYTLQGPSTLFYPLPKGKRKEVSKHLFDRNYMHTFCSTGSAIHSNINQGVVFLAGKKETAALHSEPPIQENRLFFSVVPCSKKQLEMLKNKIVKFYPK